MRAELKHIQKTTGLPILYVTHDQEEAMALSDRIAVMSEGKVQQMATPEDIYARPKNRFVLDFIGAVNYLPATVRDWGESEVTLRVQGGSSITVHTDQPLHPGQGLLLATRPEDASLAVGKIPTGLNGVVTLRSFLGNSLEFQILCEKNTFRVLGGKDLPFRVDDPVSVHLHQGIFLNDLGEVVGSWVARERS
jgi:spermidine/putrescine transport system ATP-binding protein